MMFVTTLFKYVRDDWDAKVIMECVIRHIPWCICHCSEYLRSMSDKSGDKPHLNNYPDPRVWGLGLHLILVRNINR
jgi:hypothetical protein